MRATPFLSPRARWELIGPGHGIYRPEPVEDLRVENRRRGHPSGEGARSFLRGRRWSQHKLAGAGHAPLDFRATPAANTAGVSDTSE